jgi:hypothetical protein
MIPFKTGYKVADEIEMMNRIRQHDTDIERLWRLQRQQSYGWPIGGTLGNFPTGSLPSSTSSSKSSQSSSSSNSKSSGSGSQPISGSNPSSGSSWSFGSSSSFVGVCPVASATLTATIIGTPTFYGGATAIALSAAGNPPGTWSQTTIWGESLTARCADGIMQFSYVEPLGQSSVYTGPSINGMTFHTAGTGNQPQLQLSW